MRSVFLSTPFPKTISVLPPPVALRTYIVVKKRGRVGPGEVGGAQSLIVTRGCPWSPLVVGERVVRSRPEINNQLCEERVYVKRCTKSIIIIYWSTKLMGLSNVSKIFSWEWRFQPPTHKHYGISFAGPRSSDTHQHRIHVPCIPFPHHTRTTRLNTET